MPNAPENVVHQIQAVPNAIYMNYVPEDTNVGEANARLYLRGHAHRYVQ